MAPWKSDVSLSIPDWLGALARHKKFKYSSFREIFYAQKNPFHPLKGRKRNIFRGTTFFHRQI
jgi:hypothetical protein